MQQPFGQFQPPLHAAGEGLGFLFRAIGKSHARQHLGNALLQRGPAQSVDMPDDGQVLFGSQLHVDALRLEDHADVAAHFAQARAPHRAPRISALPPVGTISVERMRKVVVLPLPFGPSNPKISAGRTSNDTPAKALRSPYSWRKISELNDGAGLRRRCRCGEMVLALRRGILLNSR